MYSCVEGRHRVRLRTDVFASTKTLALISCWAGFWEQTIPRLRFLVNVLIGKNYVDFGICRRAPQTLLALLSFMQWDPLLLPRQNLA